jgi:hypothetical protein
MLTKMKYHTYKNRVNYQAFQVCVEMKIYQKHMTILVVDMFAEEYYSCGGLMGQISEPVFCS